MGIVKAPRLEILGRVHVLRSLVGRMASISVLRRTLQTRYFCVTNILRPETFG